MLLRTALSLFIITLTEGNNELIGSTYERGEPMVYLHGREQMIRGFEQAVSKADVGQTLTFNLSPSEGYGLRNVNNVQPIPIKYLKHEGQLTLSKSIHVNTDNGVKPGPIINVGKFNVDIGINHPLADKNLNFDLKIVAIRKATEQEISHGHVHGLKDCNF
jgi:FKBP-type peptidyl-prolyl cis-trans isomerase SlyD